MSDSLVTNNRSPGRFELPFADVPRMELEKLLDEVATRAQDVLTTQGRLRSLLHAQSMVASELGLQAVLQHTVAAARDLVEARYAALRVPGANGTLEAFVHVGMDEATVELIGDLPHGRGILGLLINQPTPVRLPDLAAHPAAGGFPAHHPVMDSFLGVPIRIRDRVFGHLYLACSANGQFSEEDENLAIALAGTAAVAIDNARIYEEGEQRQRWLTASAAMTQVLLADADTDPLDTILGSLQQTSGADFAMLALVVGSEHLQVKAASGVLTERVLGLVTDLESSMAGQVIRSGTPVLVADHQEISGAELPVPIGSLVMVPLLTGDETIGTLSVGRLAGRHPFTETDMTHLAGFAGHAGVAVELERARTERQDRRLIDDRDRIAVDLNKHVMQDLVSVGLSLQGVSMLTRHPGARARISQCVGLIDKTIDHIRTTVYDIDTANRHVPADLQHQILDITDSHAAALGCEVATAFTGHLNCTIPTAIADKAVAVTREALSSIAVHANATQVELRLDVTDDVTIEIIDNGPNIATPARIEAHAAFQHRFASLPGTLDIRTPPEGKHTHLVWTSPLPDTH